MKHKILLSMLSLCVLCSDAAFGARKGPAAPKPTTSAHTQALTGAQQWGIFDPLPDVERHPEGEPILNVLQKSKDPQAGEAIGALGELFKMLDAQQQTETQNATFSARIRELLRQKAESDAKYEKSEKRFKQFQETITQKSDEAKKRNDELKLANDRLTTEVGNIKKQLEQTKRTRSMESEAMKAQHEQQLSALQAELAELQATIDQGSKATIDQLTQRNAELSAQIEELRQESEVELKKYEEEITRLKQSTEGLRKGNHGLQKEIAQLKQKSDELHQHDQGLQRENTRFKKSNEELDERVKILRQQKEVLITEVKRLQLELEKATIERLSFKTQETLTAAIDVGNERKCETLAKCSRNGTLEDLNLCYKTLTRLSKQTRSVFAAVEDKIDCNNPETMRIAEIKKGYVNATALQRSLAFHSIECLTSGASSKFEMPFSDVFSEYYENLPASLQETFQNRHLIYSVSEVSDSPATTPSHDDTLPNEPVSQPSDMEEVD